MRSYNCQLARVHVEHYLYRLMQSMPNMEELASHAPITSKPHPITSESHIQSIITYQS